jgi:hypothetical protein
MPPAYHRTEIVAYGRTRRQTRAKTGTPVFFEIRDPGDRIHLDTLTFRNLP